MTIPLDWLRESSIGWRELQEEAKRRGYYSGTVDGLPGPLTLEAVRRMLGWAEA